MFSLLLLLPYRNTQYEPLRNNVLPAEHLAEPVLNVTDVSYHTTRAKDKAEASNIAINNKYILLVYSYGSHTTQALSITTDIALFTLNSGVTKYFTGIRTNIKYLKR